ncbi:MAG: hydroxymethylglutaryl-CoA lyase [Bdellovibrionales bacterium]|nr:hydroxymethylglutaryl-CoA lyase [Bdellovibrionales bacterium]
MAKQIRIVEVGLRDGLQNEKQELSVAQKVMLVDKLVRSGSRFMEIGAFVSPKWVPQMADTEAVVKEVLANKNYKTVEFSALVPNEVGMQKALLCKAPEVSVFTAVSDTFTEKNINCSVDESFKRFEPVLKLAKKNKIKVRGYLSTAFVCPYEGLIDPKKTLKVCERLLELGVYEVSVADTIGVANPKQVETLVKKLTTKFPKKKIAMHFHDTRGMALANIVKCLEQGITTFDASIGGLGGCPYAKGAAGNVATEDVVNMLHEMGYSTGIDLNDLVKTAKWLQSIFTRSLSSKLSKIID